MPTSAPEEAAAFSDVAGRRLHTAWIGRERGGTPVVFLHEGLGSVDLWRDFPHTVLAASGRPGLVYSRYGNGWSDPLTEPRPVRYLHDEAQTLPEVLAANRIGRPPLLVGHSDGASIAILHAGAGHPVAGLVLIAPHVFVDQEAVASITAIRDGFASSELPAKMARYHVAAETTFHGWAEVWLSDGFRTWNIEEYLPGIDRPVLLVQGTEDEYGTERQLEAIESAVRGPVRRLMVEGAAHSPHLSHPEVVVPAVAEFIAEVA